MTLLLGAIFLVLLATAYLVGVGLNLLDRWQHSPAHTDERDG